MSQTTTAEVSSPRLPSLWRNKAFNLLWGSQALSGLGHSISELALPLLTLGITNSPIQAGIVGTAQAVARISGQLPAGVLIDRVNRRRLMLVCDAVRLFTCAVLAWAVLTDRVTLLWIIISAMVTALFAVTHETAEFSAVRNIVPLQQVPEATARNQARMAAVNLAGPPIGGALFALARSLPFFANAFAYLLSFIGVWLIRQPMQQERTEPHEHPVKAFVEGVRFTWHEPFLRAVVLIAPPLQVALTGLAFASIVILQQRGTPPVLIGTAWTIVAVGALIGAVIAGWIVRTVPLRVLAIGGFWLMAAVIAVGSLLTDSILLALPMAVSILLMPACNSALLGYQAAVTPDRLQGRVVSVILTGAMGLAAAAPLFAGAMVDFFGPPVAVLAFAGVMACAAIAATLSKGIRDMRPIDDLPTPV
jgi:MFS family permease